MMKNVLNVEAMTNYNATETNLYFSENFTTQTTINQAKILEAIITPLLAAYTELVQETQDDEEEARNDVDELFKRVLKG